MDFNYQHLSKIKIKMLAVFWIKVQCYTLNIVWDIIQRDINNYLGLPGRLRPNYLLFSAQLLGNKLYA